ncbi:CPBP family intramembrane glutamic endopeptidase [Microbacterium sp. NPDC077391]|uniref:CPBP family intramembrane glutamic endopeptidase n=1 Tax=Microbacterium sp. NPDC077391 TaxID=3154765 RepID=UPI0034314853
MPAAPASRRDESRTHRRRPWWLGGSSVRRWNAEVLGWGLLALGAGLLLGQVIGGIIGTVVFWVVLVVPVVLAFRRGVPRGLLRLRPIDLLYGVVLGLMLRLVQGWAHVGVGGSPGFPSYPTLDGALPPLWWAEDLVGAAIVAPVVEEFFFRGMLLVAIYTVVRRMGGLTQSGQVIGALVAIVASAALFLITHQLVDALVADGVIALALLGVTCGALVMFTGRLWPAVLVHVVYNGTGVALTVVGTLLS